jgi:hypothetical protein
LFSIAVIRPACEECLNAPRKIETEFIGVGGHVVIGVLSFVLWRADLKPVQPFERGGEVGKRAGGAAGGLCAVRHAFQLRAQGAHCGDPSTAARSSSMRSRMLQALPSAVGGAAASSLGDIPLSGEGEESAASASASSASAFPAISAARDRPRGGGT